MTTSPSNAALSRSLLLGSAVLLTACTFQPVNAVLDTLPSFPADGGEVASGSAGPGADAGGADAVAEEVAPPACGTICEAQAVDGCCPAGCTSATDLDCTPSCGNAVVEKGEQCDPPGSCPASCPNRGCTKFALQGSAAACTAICVESGQQTACTPDDGCCPAGCTANEDSDCLIVCGNGVMEMTETCDPLDSCPTACPAQRCQLRKLVNAGTCAAQCVNDRQQTTCVAGDDCCPAGCHAGNDGDCAPVCGNGVKESGETCDPLASCPTSCPPMGCQLRELANAGTCQAACRNSRLQTACVSGDGCCPPSCNSTNDGDCPVRCGNSVVERGETCDPAAECSRRQAACQSDQNTIRTGKGSAAACTYACLSSPRPCGPTDGACPAGCAKDADCTPRPSSCGHIEWCRKPFQPNQGQVICVTNDDARCTDAERIAECAREARSVCGDGHVRPVQYTPPIGGRTSG